MRHPSAIRAAGLFAVLGALSGVACAFTTIDFLTVSLGWTGLFSSRGSAPLLPGIIFGLVLSYLIYARHSANVAKAASGVLTSAVAWVIAVHVAQEFRDVWAGGLVAGAVGAALTSAGVALVVPGYRSVPSMVLTVLVGTVAGLLLVIMDNDASALSLIPLFVGWQSTVVATIAYGIAKGETAEPGPVLTPAAG